MAILKNWNVLVLAILIAWTGVSYTYHIERSPPDHDSPMQLAKELADRSGKLEKTCDHCCHGGAHTLALCSDIFVFAARADSPFYPAATPVFRTRASPPITPPPQA